MNIFSLYLMVSAVDKLSSPVKKMMESLRKMNRLTRTGANMMAWGGKLTAAGAGVQMLSNQVNGAVASMVKPLTELEDELAALQTVVIPTQTVSKSMAMMTKEAMAWQKQHKQGAAEFIKTSYMMSSAGLKDVEALAATKTALALATATMGQGTEAANLLATVYKNLGNSAADPQREIGRLGDVITKTQQLFQIANLAQLSEGMKYATPVAKQYGQSLEQMNTILGMLNNAGLQGSQAGTAYSATMSKMIEASNKLGFSLAKDAKGNLDFIATLVKMRKQFGDFSQMSDAMKSKFTKVFGVEGVRAVSLLLGKTGQLGQSHHELMNSAGATGKAQKIMERTTSSRLKILRNQLTEIKMKFAAAFIDVVKPMLPSLRSMVERISEFITKHPRLMRFIAWGVVALATLGPVIIVMGTLVTKIGALMTGFGFLFKGGYKVFRLLKHLPKVGKGVLLLLKAGRFLVSGFGQALFRLGWTLMLVSAKVVAFGTTLLASPITWIIGGILALAAAVYFLIKHFDKVTEASLGFVQSFASGLFVLIDTIIPALIDSIFNLLQAFTDMIPGAQQRIDQLKHALKAQLQVGGQVNQFIQGIDYSKEKGVTTVAPLFQPEKAKAGVSSVTNSKKIQINQATFQINEKVENAEGLFRQVQLQLEAGGLQ